MATVVDVIVSGTTATVVDARVDGVTTVAGAAPITNVSGQIPTLGVDTDILAAQGDIFSLINDVAILRANLIVTGTTLTDEIGVLSGYLVSTGNALEFQISTLSGNLIASGNNLDSLRDILSGDLISTGANLKASITGITGDIDSLTTNLVSTGNNLENQIINSGSITDDISGNLITTGETLTSNLIFSGNSLDTERGVLSGNLITTGQTLYNLHTGLNRDVVDNKNNLIDTGNNLEPRIVSNLASITSLQTETGILSSATGELQEYKFGKEGGTISGSLLPSSSGTLNLGSASLPFKDGFFNDLTISANTLFIGGIPIGTADGGVDFSSATGTTLFEDVSIRNLTVTGTETIIDVEHLAVKDNIIIINSGQSGAGISVGSGGLVIDRGTLADADFIFHEGNDRFEFNFPVAVDGNVVVTQDQTGTYADSSNLIQTGITLQTQITSNDGDITTLTTATGELKNQVNTTDINLITTGQTLTDEIAIVSGIAGGSTFDELSGNLITTGQTLTSEIAIVSGIAEAHTDISELSGNLITTGQTLQTQITSNDSDISTLTSNLIVTGSRIDTVSGNLITTGQTLQTQITSNDADITDLTSNLAITGRTMTDLLIETGFAILDTSGNADTTSNNLITTGQTLTSEISIVSGIAIAHTDVSALSGKVDEISGDLITTGSYIDSVSGNLISTGNNLQTQITSNDTQIAGIIGDLVNTGTTLTNNINTVASNLVATGSVVDDVSGNLITTGQYLTDEIATVSGIAGGGGSDPALSGKVDTLSGNLITTGQHLTSEIAIVSGLAGGQDFDTLSGNLITTGQTLTTDINAVSSNLVSTGSVVDDISGNLITTGQTLQTQITSNDTDISNLTSNVITTGQTLTSEIIIVSGIAEAHTDVTALSGKVDDISGNLITTGQTLTTNINTVSTNLITTGQTLTTSIDTVSSNLVSTGTIVDDISGNLITTGQTLQTQITSNDGDITSLTSNLITTGQTLTSEIGTVSGLITDNDAEITALLAATGELKTDTNTNASNLITTGQTLTTNINTVSTNLVSTGSIVDDISGNLITTGQTLQTQITSNDGDITNLTSNLITTGQTLTTEITTVSGLITDNDGDITALKAATGVLKTSTDNNTANLISTGAIVDDISGNLITSGQTLQTQITSNDSDISTLTANVITTGQTLQTQITSNDGDISTLTSNLITTGQTLQTQITSNDGDISTLTSNLISTGSVVDDISGNLITTGQTLQTQITSNDSDISTLTSNLVTTGQTLTTNINTVSSNLVSTGSVVDDISGNLITTGQTLQTQITSNDGDISTLTTNLGTTGQTLQTQITSNDADIATLDSTTVKLTTNQSVAGNKIFTDTVTINNLTVTGTEVIVDVENLAVKDNIIHINSGESGAGISRISGGITIDRGTEPAANILYNDANDRFELNFPLATEGNVVASAANLITTGQTLQTQITANDTDIATNVSNISSLTTNLVTTGQTLQTQITSNDSDISTLTSNLSTTNSNLVTTGQTLTTNINTVSTNLVSTGSIVDDISGNLITTGQTLQTQITSNDTDITNLSSNLVTTGQTLTTNINTVANNLVTTGQTLTSEIATVSGLIPATVIDGGGTANKVPLWSDANTIGDSVISQSSSKIGIGTATPRRTLHVHQEAASSTYLQVTNSSTSSTNDGQGFQFGVGGDGTANIVQRENLALTFLTNNVERIRILAGGSVGIGNAAPGQRLSIVGLGANASSSSFRAQNSTNSAFLEFEDGGYVNLSNLRFNKSDFLPNNTDYTFKLGNSGSAGTLGYRFRDVAGTVLMDVLNTGKVGIGTTDPQKTLDVNGTSYFRNNTFHVDGAKAVFGGGDDLQIYHDGSNSYITDSGTGDLKLLSSGLAIQSANGNEYLAYFAGTGGQTVSLYAGNSKKFETTSTGVTVTGALKTTTILDTNNSAGTNGQVLVSTGAAIDWKTLAEISGVDGSGTAGYLSKWTDGDTIGDSIIYESSSKIGIGTVTPSYRLHVASNAGYLAYFQNTSASDYRPVGFTDENNAVVGTIGYNTTNNVFSVGDTTGPVVSLVGGKVGIGTIAPSADLEVSTASGGEFLVTRSGNSGVTLQQVNGGDATSGSLSIKAGTAMTLYTNGTGRALTIDSSQNVGIGTDTPGSYDSRAERLVVHESGDGGITIATGATSDGRLVFARSGDTGLDHGEISYDQNTDHMGFATAGSRRVTIDANGDVGIGGTPVNSPLNVFSDGGANCIRLIGRANGTTDESCLSFMDNDNSTENCLILNIGKDLGFHTNSAERMRLNSSGNLGIGTTLPLTRTHIRTAGAAIAGGNAIKSSTMKGLSITNSANDTSSVGIWFGTNASHWSGISAQRESTSTWGTDLRFYTHEDNTQNLTYASERMRIDPHGNVGIGTTNPEEELHVYGAGDVALLESSSANVWLQMKGSTTYSWQIGSTDKGLQFYNDETSAYRVVFKKDGNVGIGTDAPAWKLHVLGNDGVAKIESSSANSWLQLKGSTTYSWEIGATSSGLQFYSDAETNTRMNLTDGGQLKLNTYGSGTHTGTAAYKLSVTSGGIVIETPIGAGAVDGAGTANYISKWTDGDTIGNSSIHEGAAGSLQIEGPSAGRFLTLNAPTTGGYITFETADTAFADIGTPKAISGIATYSTTDLMINARSGAKNIVFGMNGYEKVRIDSNGKVGIGTTAPAVLLDIYEPSSGSAWIKLGNSSRPAGMYIGMDAGELQQIYVGGNNPFTFWTNDTEKVRITGDGKVGIGTDAPSKKLHVHSGASGVGASGDVNMILEGASNVGLAMLAPNNQGSRIEFGSVADNNEGIIYYNNTGSYFSIYTNGTRQVDITSDGNFGIGTATPGNVLPTDFDSDGLILEVVKNAKDAGITLGYKGTTVLADIWTNASTSNLNIDNRYNSANAAYGCIDFRTRTKGTMVNAVRIQPDGNVGIGTTAAGKKLEVRGEVRIADAGIPKLWFYDTSTAQLASIRHSSGTTRLGIFDDSNNERFTVITEGGASQGRVGIGTAAPKQKLHIFQTEGGVGVKHATIRLGGYLDKGAEIAAYRTASNSNNMGLKFSAHNVTNGIVDVMTLDDLGNVGVGTNTPTARLESWGAAAGSVFKALTLTNDARPSSTLTGTGVKLEFNTADAQEGPSTTAFIQAKHTAETFNASAVLQFSAGNTGAIHQTIQSDGNVGIGTTAPANALHVYSTTGNASAVLIDGSASNSGFLSFRQAGVEKSYIQYTSNSYLRYFAAGGHNFAQNVGINKTVPDSWLHIEDDYSLTKHLLHVKGGGASGAYGVLVETANGTDLFKIDTLSYKVSMPSGYPVGIGTPDPAALLHIQHATAPNIRIERTTGATSGSLGLIEFGARSVDDNLVTIYAEQDGATDAGKLTFSTEATGGALTERMTIKSDGKVGIGTTAPDRMLHLYGGASGQATPTASSLLVLEDDGSSNYISFLNPNTGNAGIIWGDPQDSARAQLIYDHNTGYMTFNPGGAERVFFKSDGKVGINSTNPSTILSLGGSLATGGIYINSGADEDHTIIDMTGITGGGKLIWDDGEEAFSMSKGLRVTAGNVGIGTTAPSGAILDIVAGDNSTPQIKLRAIGANTQAKIHASGSSGNFELFTGDGDGNQTIKLSIARTSGAATFSGTVNAAHVISTGYAQASSLRIPSTTNYHEIWSSGDELRIYRNQSAAIRIGASNLVTLGGALAGTSAAFSHTVDPGTTPTALSVVLPGMSAGTATNQYAIKVTANGYNNATNVFGVHSTVPQQYISPAYALYGETNGVYGNVYGLYTKATQSNLGGGCIAYGIYALATSASSSSTVGKTYGAVISNTASLGARAVGLYVNSTNGEPLIVDSGGSERFKITNAGTVTTAGLQLGGGVISHGSSNASSIVLCGGNSSSTTGANITLGGNSGSADRAVIFKANSTETLRIASDGNVGIGTTSPAAKLHVAGRTYLSDKTIIGRNQSMSPRLVISAAVKSANIGKADTGMALSIDSGAQDNNQSVGHLTQIGLGLINAYQPTAIGAMVSISGAYTAAHLVFATRPNYNDIAPTERMRITDAGKVFIGDTTASNAQLRVKQSTSGEWGVNIINHQSVAYGLSIDTSSAASTAAYNFAAYTPAGTGFFVTNTGCVGIGAAAPDYLLTLQNDDATIRLRSNTTTTKGVTLRYNHSGSFGELRCDQQGVNQLDMKYYSLSHKFGRNDSLQYLTIDSAGATTLDGTVSVGGTANGLLYIKEDNGSNTIQLRADVSNSYNEIDSQKEFNIRTEAGALRFSTANTERMRILADGNFGIGTTTPEGRVDVQMKMSGVDWTYGNWGEVWDSASQPGSKFNDCVFHIDTNRGGGVTGGIVGLAFSPGWQGHQNWGIYSTNESGGSWTQGDLRFVNQINNGTITERVTFKADGNVGIGTTAPAGALHVRKTTANQPFAIFEDTGTNSNPAISIKNDAQEWLTMTVGARSDNWEVWDQTGSATRLAVTTGGKVGIGTNVPGDLLHIYGTRPTIRLQGGSGLWMMRSDDNQSHRFEIIDANGGYDKFAIYPGNTGAIVLHSDGAGCVGIGTAAPGGKLHVYGLNNSAGDLWTVVGTGNTPNITIQNASATDNTNAALFFKNDSVYVGGIGMRFTNHSSDAAQMRFSTCTGGNTRERMILDESGHLLPAANGTYNLGGSGNYWASCYFENTAINGTLYAGGVLTVAGNIIPAADGTYNLGSTSSQDWKELYIREIDMYNQRLRIYTSAEKVIFRDHSSIGQGITFQHRNTHVMTIGDASGNTRVGIGTTAPVDKLHLASGGKFRNGHGVEYSSSTYITNNTTTNYTIAALAYGTAEFHVGLYGNGAAVNVHVTLGGHMSSSSKIYCATVLANETLGNATVTLSENNGNYVVGIGNTSGFSIYGSFWYKSSTYTDGAGVATLTVS